MPPSVCGSLGRLGSPVEVVDASQWLLFSGVALVGLFLLLWMIGVGWAPLLAQPALALAGLWRGGLREAAARRSWRDHCGGRRRCRRTSPSVRRHLRYSPPFWRLPMRSTSRTWPGLSLSRDVSRVGLCGCLDWCGGRLGSPRAPHASRFMSSGRWRWRRPYPVLSRAYTVLRLRRWLRTSSRPPHELRRACTGQRCRSSRRTAGCSWTSTTCRTASCPSRLCASWQRTWGRRWRSTYPPPRRRASTYLDTGAYLDVFCSEEYLVEGTAVKSDRPIVGVGGAHRATAEATFRVPVYLDDGGVRYVHRRGLLVPECPHNLLSGGSNGPRRRNRHLHRPGWRRVVHHVRGRQACHRLQQWHCRPAPRSAFPSHGTDTREHRARRRWTSAERGRRDSRAAPSPRSPATPRSVRGH